MAEELGVKMVPCSTSCGLLGLPDDAFRGGIGDQVGAAYFLALAKESKVSFFI
jgi:peroxiredoxin family protein